MSKQKKQLVARAFPLKSTTIILAFLCTCMLTAIDGNTMLNVRLFGAAGDGKNDDTAALQAAFDAAVKKTAGSDNPTFRVMIPTGVYRITKTLNLSVVHCSILLQGAGQWGQNAENPPTRILWDGVSNGTMLDGRGVFAVRMCDLYFDGAGKAGTIISVDSAQKSVSAQWSVERVTLRNAQRGFVCGADSKVCNSDMTFIDLVMKDLDIGFHTCDFQALNYTFIRPQIGRCNIGFYFQQGGSVFAEMVTGHNCGTVVKIGGGGLNAGTFHFSTMRMESYKRKGKRQVILETTGGEVNVKFDALLTTALSVWGAEADFDTPNFILGPGTQVTVDTSIISGKVAALKGNKNSMSLIQFNNCRFRASTDPRSIEHDGNSGYSLRDCYYIPKDGDAVFITNKVEFGAKE